jgi:NitT/TauT family transport system permease protein
MKKEDGASGLWFWAALTALLLALAENIAIPAGAVRYHEVYYRIVLAAGAAALIIARLCRPGVVLRKARFIFACTVAVIAWDLFTAKGKIFPEPYCPALSEVLSDMWSDRSLLALSALYSFRLFAFGLILGTFLGLATGVTIGWWKEWDYWLSPVIRISGIIPPVALLPIALLVFPTSFTTGLFLIFISSWFPVSSMAAAGIVSTPRSYFEAARTLGADDHYLLFHVALPNAMPNIFTGVNTATAFSFTTLIISEMVGAKAGLGFYINWAKGWGAYSKMYGALIIIAIEFSIILALVTALKNVVLRWQKGIVK